VLSISRRANPDVDGDVENRPADAPYEFTLGLRGQLEVKPSEHPFRGGLSMIVLNEGCAHLMRGEHVGAIGFRKETALVAVPGGEDHEHVGDLLPVELHSSTIRLAPLHKAHAMIAVNGGAYGTSESNRSG
jgi:hypothetical protein